MYWTWVHTNSDEIPCGAYTIITEKQDNIETHLGKLIFLFYAQGVATMANVTEKELLSRMTVTHVAVQGEMLFVR